MESINTDQIIGFIVFTVVSVVGWQVFDRLHVSAASILGALCFVAIANICGLPLFVPKWLKFIMTVNLGISIGSKYDIHVNKNLIGAVIAFIFVIVLGCMGIKTLVVAAGVDKGTAIFASLLGGLTELSFLAQEFKFDAFVVSIFQTVRSVLMVILIPIIASKFKASNAPKTKKAASYPKPDKKDWIILIVLAVLFVELLTLLKVPAGKMIGAAVSTAVYSSIRKIKPRINKSWHSLMLSFIGGSTGMNVSKRSIIALPSVIKPLLVYVAGVAVVTFIVFLLAKKIGKLDNRTAVFCSSMGGLAPTIAASEAMDADSSVVSTFQIIRYFTVIALALMLGYVT